jgi:hypothetical protein
LDEKIWFRVCLLLFWKTFSTISWYRFKQIDILFWKTYQLDADHGPMAMKMITESKGTF